MNYNIRAVTAVVIAILMVTGIIAPVTATGVEDPTSLIDQSTVQNDDLSALEHRAAAYEILTQNDEQRQLDLLNETFEHVLDENRIDARSVFHEDRLVVAETQAHYSEAADHLVASDRALAETAVADARRVVEQMKRRNHSYNETAVDDYLANATGDLQEGHTHVENDEPVAGVEAYQRAWTAAQRALDVMQAAVEPQVTITRREDHAHNGNLTYVVEGVVWDVRSHRMNGSLAVNGETVDLALNNSTVPGGNATFERTITLEQQVNRINVSVTTSLDYVDYDRVGDRPLDDERPPGDGGPPDNGSDNDSEAGTQVGYDVLKLDGDGLPDRYETNVTGTAPLNPDSDSRFTERNESDLDLLDGAKDFSGDELIAYREYRIGTDPLTVDTTGDGLRDRFQIRKAGTDPTVNDTDADGTPDVEEDLSGDGLTLIEEQEYGTNPLINDTDDDWLTDYEEVHKQETDPLAQDTDQDGLTDGEELDLGTDPLAPDTDGNGVLDGNETYTRAVTDEESGVDVQVTGEGYAGGDVTIRDVSSPNTSDVRVGPAVWIRNGTSFENATVRVPLNESVDLTAERSNLTLVKSSLNGGGWERLNATVDRENRSLVATVESFSLIMAVNGTEWNDQRTARIDAGWPYLETFEDLEGWEGDGEVEDGSLVVASGEANFSVTEFHAPDEATEGETITVEATIENTGALPANQTVAYVFSGSEIAYRTVELEPGEQQSVQFQVNPFEDHPDLTPLSRTYDHAVVTDDDRWNATITFSDDEEDDDGGSAEPEFEVTSFDAPSSVEAGEIITVTAELTNTGGKSGETNVTYYFDGAAGKTRNKTVDSGETVPIRFRVRVPVLIDEGYYDHWITANRSGDSDGDEIFVAVDEDPTLIFPILSQGAATPRICLPGQTGGQCSITAGPSRSVVTGRYGAADVFTDRDQAAAGAVSLKNRSGETRANEPESRAVRTLDLSKVDETDGEVDITLTYSATVYSNGSWAQIRVIGPEKTMTVVKETGGGIQSRGQSPSTVTADLSQFAGKEVQIEVMTHGGARAKVHSIEVERDSDGDGIRDLAEIATQREDMPITYLVENDDGESIEQSQDMELDPYEKDTNGDGLSDGRQVDFDVERERDPNGPGILGFKIDGYSADAHPNKNNTDELGLTDAEELSEGSNPIIPQRVKFSVKFPVRAEGSDHADMEYEPKTVGDEYLIAPVDKWPTSPEEDDRPPWLPDGVEIDGSYIYFKVPILITINSKDIANPDDAVPSQLTINLAGSDEDVHIVDGGMELNTFEDLEPGVNERTLTIKIRDQDEGAEVKNGDNGAMSSTSICDRAPTTEVECRDAGAFQIQTDYDDNSPYERIENKEITSNSMILLDFKELDAAVLNNRGVDILRKGVLWAMDAYQKPYAVALKVIYSQETKALDYIMDHALPDGEIDWAANIYRTDHVDWIEVGLAKYAILNGGPKVVIVN